jgi:UDP-N-acetylglucosamine diphosphorylase/glucosamine-1-phosphate N-acetyltransferase
MNYILFDGKVRNQLLPFTFTRPVADIRVGILTIREKWEKFLGSTTTTVTEEYLSDKFPMVELEQNVLINASFCPSENLVLLIKDLQENQAIFYKDEPLAFYAKEDQEIDFDTFKVTQYTDDDVLRIENTWDIFEKNHLAIQRDYDVLTQGRTSEAIPQNTIAFNPKHIFIEKGAKVMCASLNATDGPIYIGKGSVLMEGATIQGPFALCEHSSVKMGAKIYGGTTIGPHCKVGGEVANSVMMGFSNKGHEGYMGNSVLGHWCNLGADTNTSNLKNNYAQVRLWDYDTERFAKTGIQFCGLMMGDHSKCGINTMFNTGTVVGVSANIFGAGYPRNFIPSFTWGGSSGMESYNTKKAFEVATVVMARRGLEFDTQEEAVLNEVFEISKQWRRF